MNDQNELLRLCDQVLELELTDNDVVKILAREVKSLLAENAELRAELDYYQ